MDVEKENCRTSFLLSVIKKRPIMIGFKLALIVVVIAACWVSLELGASDDYTLFFLQMNIKYVVYNCMLLFVLGAIIYIVVNKIWLSLLGLSIISVLISVINYYVIELHGNPLTFFEILNLSTAWKVLGGYRLHIEKRPVACVFLFCCNLLFVLVYKKIEEKNRKSLGRRKRIIKRLLTNMGVASVAALIIYIGFYAKNPIKPQKTVGGWWWQDAYHRYGYATCSLEVFLRRMSIIQKPEGYHIDDIKSIELRTDTEMSSVQPDIILILNETFYDLGLIMDINTDIPYMSNIDRMTNTIKGYCISPMEGGGTNHSEYELLTSNSVTLMPGITPFTILNLDGANSIVSYLKGQGYLTTGAHSESKLNYARGIAYEALGFDYTYFDEDFIDIEYYGERTDFATDESLYRNLIKWYEKQNQEEEGPKFIYLLTMQNHGGWEGNPEEYDIVHVEGDYGAYEDELNEYLTCIYQSDLAFAGLTDYFSHIERPVCICMVGDHCPIFAGELVEESYKEEENIRLRATPFIMWANYEITEDDLKNISMPYLVPVLLKTANMEMSYYYSYLYNMSKEVPIINQGEDLYVDTDGNCYGYEQDGKYKQLVSCYFNLEYNNLSNERRQALFK